MKGVVVVAALGMLAFPADANSTCEPAGAACFEEERSEDLDCRLGTNGGGSSALVGRTGALDARAGGAHECVAQNGYASNRSEVFVEATHDLVAAEARWGSFSDRTPAGDSLSEEYLQAEADVGASEMQARAHRSEYGQGADACGVGATTRVDGSPSSHVVSCPVDLPVPAPPEAGWGDILA